MTGDFSRDSFKKTVKDDRMRSRQGPVQRDEDVNEHANIDACRTETGAPFGFDGFRIVAEKNDLTDMEIKRNGNNNIKLLQPGVDFYFSCGRMYVDGILCENGMIDTYAGQPHCKDLAPMNTSGSYLAYLDVWERHITALEDSSIREVASGGPDTSTRTKTVWQLRYKQVGKKSDTVDYATEFLKIMKEYDEKRTGMLAAFDKKSKAPVKDQGHIQSDTGHRRLENRLYRVEVHKGGALNDAVFKWSRDNSSVVAPWVGQDPLDRKKLIVEMTRQDQQTGFSQGQWVELIDDARVLNCDIREQDKEDGVIVMISSVSGNILTIDPGIQTVDISQFKYNPRIRRWDMGEAGFLNKLDTRAIELESGVCIQFTDGTYKKGDYWTIPARSTGSMVEWPLDQNNNPEFLPPHGIAHHHACLAIMKSDGAKITNIRDCRKIFSSVKKPGLIYSEGDGQNGWFGVRLPEPVSVRVVDGDRPVRDVKVTFKVLTGGGKLSLNNIGTAVDTELSVTTDHEGKALCYWTIGEWMNSQRLFTQTMEAVLVDAMGGQYITEPAESLIFSAQVVKAGEVYYADEKSGLLRYVTSVNDTLDRMAAPLKNARISITSFDERKILQSKRPDEYDANESDMILSDIDIDGWVLVMFKAGGVWSRDAFTRPGDICASFILMIDGAVHSSAVSYGFGDVTLFCCAELKSEKKHAFCVAWKTSENVTDAYLCKGSNEKNKLCSRQLTVIQL